MDAVLDDPTTEITVDLQALRVSAPAVHEAFEIDPYTRWRLLEGLDDIDLTLRNADAIDAYERAGPPGSRRSPAPDPPGERPLAQRSQASLRKGRCQQGDVHARAHRRGRSRPPPKRTCPATGRATSWSQTPGGQAAPPRERRLAGALDGHRGGPRAAEGVPPDARRGHRRAGGTPDPDRRPLARGLRLLQLPGPRPRPGGHRRGPRVPREVGHPPVLVPAARQPRPVRTARGDHHGAARVRGLAAASDDHPHPHVGDPGPGRQRRDLPRRPGAQDDLRRREHRPRARRDDPALPPQRRRAPRAARQGARGRPPA